MDTLTMIGIFLVVWGAAVGLLALAKPKSIWKMGKIQGFVQLLGEKGTVILFLILGAAALVGGMAILL
jgi:hypothetical protein